MRAFNTPLVKFNSNCLSKYMHAYFPYNNVLEHKPRKTLI